MNLLKLHACKFYVYFTFTILSCWKQFFLSSKTFVFNVFQLQICHCLHLLSSWTFHRLISKMLLLSQEIKQNHEITLKFKQNKNIFFSSPFVCILSAFWFSHSDSPRSFLPYVVCWKYFLCLPLVENAIARFQVSRAITIRNQERERIKPTKYSRNFLSTQFR